MFMEDGWFRKVMPRLFPSNLYSLLSEKLGRAYLEFLGWALLFKELKLEPRQLDIFQFIDAKLRIGDLDALYPAMLSAKVPLRSRQHMALGAVLWDHAGVSAWVAEEAHKGVNFWAASRYAVSFAERGGARARFRGDPARAAISAMEAIYPDPAELFKRLQGHYLAAAPIVRELPLMGPWAAFKLCDISERTCGNRVDFTGVTLEDTHTYTTKAAKIAADSVALEVDVLMVQLHTRSWPTLAPPLFDRSTVSRRTSAPKKANRS